LVPPEWAFAETAEMLKTMAAQKVMMVFTVLSNQFAQ